MGTEGILGRLDGFASRATPGLEAYPGVVGSREY